MNIARDIHSVQLMTNDYINWLLYWSLEIVSGTKQTLHFLFQSCAITVVISSWPVLNIFRRCFIVSLSHKKVLPCNVPSGYVCTTKWCYRFMLRVTMQLHMLNIGERKSSTHAVEFIFRKIFFFENSTKNNLNFFFKKENTWLPIVKYCEKYIGNKFSFT